MEKPIFKIAEDTEMFCRDCGKQVTFGTGFEPFIHENGDCQGSLFQEETKEEKSIKFFVKCLDCFRKNPKLNFQDCEVYTRVVGYMRPVTSWNQGKREEYKDRKTFSIPKK